ncbi:hypothetical protein ACVWYN_000097 [Pedobacter sp. UYP24]
MGNFISVSKNLIGVILLHIILFGPRFRFFDSFLIFSVLLSVIFVVLFAVDYLRIPLPIANFLKSFSLCIAYSTLVAICWGFKDMTLFVEFLKLYIFTFSALIIVKYVSLYKSDFEKWINTRIYYATVLNAFIVCITAFSPFIKNNILPLMSFKLADSWDVLSGTRSTDWSMGGGTALSIIFVAVYVIGKKYQQDIKFHLEGNILLFLGSFLSGRTGFYLLCILAVYFVFRDFRGIISSILKPTIRKSTIIRLMIYPIIVCILIIKLKSIVDLDIITDRILPWAFESFYQYVDGGKVESQTTSILFNDFYFLPKSNIGAIFGELNFVGNSDVGYIKIIHYIGFVGLSFILLPFIYVLLFSVINFKRVSFCRFLLFYLLLIFFINFKELFLMNSRTGFLLLMIWFSIAVHQKQSLCRINLD